MSCFIDTCSSSYGRPCLILIIYMMTFHHLAWPVAAGQLAIAWKSRRLPLAGPAGRSSRGPLQKRARPGRPGPASKYMAVRRLIGLTHVNQFVKNRLFRPAKNSTIISGKRGGGGENLGENLGKLARDVAKQLHICCCGCKQTEQGVFFLLCLLLFLLQRS